jgi:hypothetical protein
MKWVGNSVATTEVLSGCDSYHRSAVPENPAERGEQMTKLDRGAVQGLLDAAEAGDYGPVFESVADNIIVENGPGAGPWRHAEGRDEFATVLLEFAAFFNGTFHQRGRCIYVDNRVVINLIEESGSTPAGDTFENLAVYVTRIGADDKGDRLWTVDLDTEACLEFWTRNPTELATDHLGEQGGANDGGARVNR